MDQQDRAFLERLSQRLTGTSAESLFLPVIRRDGGLDASDVTDDDFRSLFQGTYTGSWWPIAFFSSECLAFCGAHLTLGEDLTAEQAIGWAFCVLALSDALAHDASDWELQVNIVIASFVPVRKHLDAEEVLWMARRVFGSSGTSGTC